MAAYPQQGPTAFAPPPGMQGGPRPGMPAHAGPPHPPAKGNGPVVIMVVIAIVVLIFICLAGYLIYSKESASTTLSSATAPGANGATVTASVPTPPASTTPASTTPGVIPVGTASAPLGQWCSQPMVPQPPNQAVEGPRCGPGIGGCNVGRCCSIYNYCGN
jgi:hypothetical protein